MPGCYSIRADLPFPRGAKPCGDLRVKRDPESGPANPFSFIRGMKASFHKHEHKQTPWVVLSGAFRLQISLTKGSPLGDTMNFSV